MADTQRTSVRTARSALPLFIVFAATSCADLLSFEYGRLGDDAAAPEPEDDGAVGGMSMDASSMIDASDENAHLDGGVSDDVGGRGGAGGTANDGGPTGTGGTAGAADASHDTTDSGGAGGMTGDAAIDVPADRGTTCPTGQKFCGTGCVPANDPATGCAETSCSPCPSPHGMAICNPSGRCGIGSCSTGYHPCTVSNVTTCADDNSPSSCGTMTCNPCALPTDPHADPAPTCINQTCGFQCKAGFNLCAGVCSDTNSVSTCGPSCETCVKPANAMSVTCNGTSCGVICNPGYEANGKECVVASNLYVSPTGSDTNAGTEAAPLRTWKRVSQLAQAGTIVNFSAGSYDGAGGDDFTDAIPSGVTLQRFGAGTVTFTADEQHSLVFAGSGSLQNITLAHFRSPLSATTGIQTIKGVTVVGQFAAVRVDGNAIMVISDGSNITGAPTDDGYLVQVASTAQLTMRDSTITGTWGGCFASPVGGGIAVVDSATLSLVNSTCTGITEPCVWATAQARVGLTNSSLTASCSGLSTAGSASVIATNTAFTSMETRETSSWTISGGSVSDAGFGVGLNGSGRVSFRGCRFNGGVNGVSIGGLGTYDFGTSTSPGNNTFNAVARMGGGLNVIVDGAGVQAHGNKWVPNQQGADANGVMPSAFLVGPLDGINVSIGSSQSSVDM